MKDKVSIIIPVYKNIHFLNQSLYSAINQTYKNIEVLLINDGNTLEDKKKIYKVRSKFKKKNISIINIKKNKGVSNALNVGIKKSKGQYISWLSHDDFFSLKKTEEQIKFLKKKNAKVCSCDFIEINKIKNYKITRTLDQNYFDDQVLSIILNDSLHGCSLLIEKKCFDKNFFDRKYKHIQDYDLWAKMSEKYMFIHLNKKLLFSFKHTSQNSYVKKDESTVEKLKFYKSLVENKLIIYDYKNFIYIFKFIYRSLIKYRSPSLAQSILKKYLFYKFYNYLNLYLRKN
ncbi:glycosyltransferase [Candidatus Pelagibacter sp.]|nr:glycosyltransferase [Candidatus Pelagibacter sp.]